MKGRVAVYLGIISIAIPFSNVVAEDVNEIFERTKKFISSENYPKALEELEWAKKEIEKMHYSKLDSVFPEAFGDYKGEKGTSQSAMGFLSFEKKYKKDGESQGVNLTYVGSGAGGMASGFAAFGRMAAAMGGSQPGMDSFRIKGRTASLSDQGGSAELSIFLDGGGVLKLEAEKSDELKKMAETLDLDKIDNYLAGK